ncbi:MAG TPA: tetratricopeptide repeat protein [Polyangiales bacterium]
MSTLHHLHRPKSALAACVALALFGCTAARPAHPTARPTVPATLAERYLQTGDAYLQRGDLLRAEQYFASAVQAGYPQIRALPRLLRACLAAGRVRAALGYAQSYLLDAPMDPAARYLVASLHVALGQPIEAHAELLQVVEERPDYAPAHYLLAALSREDLPDPRTARSELATYLQLAPSGPHAAEARAWLEAHGPKQTRPRGKR